MDKETETIRCNFCGKPAAEVNKLIGSPPPISCPRVYICDTCVLSCVGILEDEGLPDFKSKLQSLEFINNLQSIERLNQQVFNNTCAYIKDVAQGVQAGLNVNIGGPKRQRGPTPENSHIADNKE